MKLNHINQPINPDKNENHTFLSLKFAVSYSLFLLIILIMMVCLHSFSVKNNNERFWQQNETSFQSAISLLDSNFSIMDSYCRQLPLDSDFCRLARMTDTDKNDFYLAGLRLKNNLPSSLYSYADLPINSYFIYLRNTGYVASVNAFTTENLFYANYYRSRYTVSDLESWQNQIFAQNKSGTMYTLYDRVVSGCDDAYLYLIDVDSLTYSTLPVTAGFHISYQKLKKIFAGVSLENGGYILALDENDTPVFYISEARTAAACMEDAPIDTLLAEISALDFKNNNAEMEHDGNSMHVTYSYADTNDWRIYLIQPDSLYSTSYQDFFIFFLIAAFLLGLLLVNSLVKNNMAPIRQLDFVLQETITDRNQLKEMVETTRPIIHKTYLKQLMQGNVSSPDELDYIRNFLHLTDTALHYYVMYGIVYENEFVESNETLHGKVENLNEIIEQGLAEYFTCQNTLYLFSPKERVYAILLPFEGESDKMLISLQERVLKLHSELLEQYSIWFFTGIGLPCEFSNIWESYQQAKDASGYTTKNYIFLPYEMLKKDSHVYYYPSEFSTKMIQFISTGSSTQVTELFHLIHQENLEERSLPFHLLKFLLSDIRNTLLKARFAITNVSAENEPVLNEIDTLLATEDLTFHLCEEIALKLCSLCSTKSEKSNLIDTIVEYIRNNFKDPSLCLNKISDEFNISESYFSHMFKETMNINFSVYLEDMRLNEAARLIHESNSNLAEIALEVGYNNQTSFRRAFKKKFGVTPSAMSNS